MRRMSGRLAGAVAVVALAVAGCAVPVDRAAAPVTPSQGTSTAPSTPTPAPTPTPTPSAPPAPTPTPSATPTPTPTPSLVPGPTIWGPGSTGPEVRVLEARLRQIRWFTGPVDDTYDAVTTRAVTGFQRKRGFPQTGEVDQRTWDRLVQMSRPPTQDQLNNVTPTPTPPAPVALDERCLTGRVVCISKQSRTLWWVVDGQTQMTLAVRFGSEFTPTREGAFSIYAKSANHVSRLYGSPMPYAMFFSGGQAVHYSADFARRGYAGRSHGCVNTRDLAGTKALFDTVVIGDRVVVY